VSPAAKLTYAMLLKNARQQDFCFPGHERLAKDMGYGVRSVVRYMQELEDSGCMSAVSQPPANIDGTGLKRLTGRPRGGAV
jgi:hypothetical protein